MNNMVLYNPKIRRLIDFFQDLVYNKFTLYTFRSFMTAFKNWYSRNQDAITWFLIGWLSVGMIENLFKGDYIWAAVSASLIYLNYKLIPVRL